MLANHLAMRGHQIDVYSPSPTPKDSLYNVVSVLPKKKFKTFRFAWDLRKYDFSHYDVLNAHGDDWFLFGKKLPKHIHTYHGSCLAEMLNHRTIKGKTRSGLLAVLEQLTALWVDDTVTVSSNTQRYIKGINHVIPCGVDLSKFHPQGNKSPNPTILFVGTINSRKRGDLLYEHFTTNIVQKVKGAKLVCVCDKPDKLPIHPDVTFTGRIAENELCQLYREAWIFCLPSTYEGFGVPYIEALASGTPVVATANPGACEVLGNGKYGLICKDEDLSNTLIRILDSPSLRRELTIKGLERSKEYSWATICKKYENLYYSSKLK